MPKIPKALKLIFACTIVLMLSVVGFFGLKAYHSLEVKLPNILAGVESKKIGFYTSNIVFKDKTIDKNQAEYLISLFEGDEAKLKTVEKWLKEDAENLKKIVITRVQDLLDFKKWKSFRAFDDYKIHLDPLKLKVEKNR